MTKVKGINKAWAVTVETFGDKISITCGASCTNTFGKFPMTSVLISQKNWEKLKKVKVCKKRKKGIAILQIS